MQQVTCSTRLQMSIDAEYAYEDVTIGPADAMCVGQMLIASTHNDICKDSHCSCRFVQRDESRLPTKADYGAYPAIELAGAQSHLGAAQRLRGVLLQ